MTRRNRTFPTGVARAYQRRRSRKPAEHQASGATTLSGVAAQATFAPGGSPFNSTNANHASAIRIAAATTCHQRRANQPSAIAGTKIVGLTRLLRTERATASGMFTAATHNGHSTIGHSVVFDQEYPRLTPMDAVHSGLIQAHNGPQSAHPRHRKAVRRRSAY